MRQLKTAFEQQAPSSWGVEVFHINAPQNDSESSGPNVGLIVGLSIGGGLLVIFLALTAVLLLFFRRRIAEAEPEAYSMM